MYRVGKSSWFKSTKSCNAVIDHEENQPVFRVEVRLDWLNRGNLKLTYASMFSLPEWFHSDAKKVTSLNFIRYEIIINFDVITCIPFHSFQEMYRNIKKELYWNDNKTNCKSHYTISYKIQYHLFLYLMI